MTLESVTIPVFPLPNLVFFPNTLLPLHIFEPRYKEMVQDAIGGDKLIGVAQLRPGWEQDYYGTPPVYKTIGVGKILRTERLADGRFDIILEGLFRGHIVRESMRGEYRVAEVNVLKEYIPIEKREEVDNVFPLLQRTLHKIVGAFPEIEQSMRGPALTKPTPGILADLLAFAFLDNAYEKQSMLSELDVSRRLRLLQVHMKNVLRNPQSTAESEEPEE
jgi:Lon protease-like protein